MLAAGQELQVAARFEIIDRFRPGLQKGTDQLAVGALPNQRVQIGFRLQGRVAEACGAALMVAGDPQRAGRGRAGATDLVGLLGQQHVEAFERGDQRGRHAGGTRADNEQINFARAVHRRTLARVFRPRDMPNRC